MSNKDLEEAVNLLLSYEAPIEVLVQENFLTGHLMLTINKKWRSVKAVKEFAKKHKFKIVGNIPRVR